MIFSFKKDVHKEFENQFKVHDNFINYINQFKM